MTNVTSKYLLFQRTHFDVPVMGQTVKENSPDFKKVYVSNILAKEKNEHSN